MSLESFNESISNSGLTEVQGRKDVKYTLKLTFKSIFPRNKVHADFWYQIIRSDDRFSQLCSFFYDEVNGGQSNDTHMNIAESFKKAGHDFGEYVLTQKK